ncbi:MAG: HhH-GPD-type base excision DNA repair protein [Candidatus Dormibacteria bacterium]
MEETMTATTTTAADRTLAWTPDAAAARLLARDALALLIGFQLDQQVAMEWAFGAPETLRQRLGGKLDAKKIAAMDPAALVEAYVAKPPLHRYPASMARRCQALCQLIVAEYGGKAAAIWGDGSDADTVVKRIAKLPGFSASKGQVIVGVLAKRLATPMAGWEKQAPSWFSLADVDSSAALLKYRELKKAAKQAGNWPPTKK